MYDTLGPFNLLLLAMPGLALIVVARTLHRPVAGSRPPMQQALRMAGQVMLLLALIGAAVALLHLLAVLVIPMIAAIWLMVVDRYRRGEHQVFLQTLAAGVKRGVPLNVTARAYAEENGGDAGTRAAALAEALESGLTLRDAARRARIKMSTATRLALRLGESLGQLGNILFRALGDSAEIDAALRSATSQLFYLAALLWVGVAILMFVMLKIIPVYMRMLDELGLLLPQATQSLVAVSETVVNLGWGPVAPFFLLLIALPLFGTLHFVGWMPANGPLLSWFGRKYDNALVLHGLARCVQRRLSLSDAIGVLSQEFPRRSTAGRLQRAWQGIQRGENWIDALQKARLLGRSEAAVLSAAERNGNLEWALDEMADSSLRRYILWLQFRCQIAVPVVVLLLGGCVGYVAIALLLPLFAVIQGLS